MDDLFDFDLDLFSAEETAVSDANSTVTDLGDPGVETYILRSHNHWQQVPIPDEYALAGTNVLADLPDDVLLNMSATLIAHVQRTEACNGMQVVSPRTVTLGGIAARTAHDKRTTDMMLVGSAASRNLDWPTVGGAVPDGLFFGEPIDSYPSDPAPRARTVTSGLIPSTRLLPDPITRAFMAGRALVDLQRRPDVAGSADALSSLLASCWGLEPDAYEDLAEASLAPTGPLLRYAIRADSSYPTINAPVQAKKCISVGANTAGRQLYGEHSAIDWRRLRVLAESVFYQSSRLEGYTLSQMTLTQPPGNPRASPNRPGVLQMRPLPGSVWTFEPATFRVDVDPHATAPMAVRVPDRIRMAVEAYHDEVRPIARAAAAGANISFSRTLVAGVRSETAESLVAGYKMILSKQAAFQARGKTAAAAIRGFMYESLADSGSLPSTRAIWLARYMHETAQALNMSYMLDHAAGKHVASRLSEVVVDMRAKLGVEAGRRGATLDEWWDDFRSQLPGKIAAMSEGSATWGIGLAHYLLHPPSDRWAKLTRALAHRSHSVMARAHLVDVRLPAMIGSEDRSFQAGLAVAKQLGVSYGAYYSAMYDVAMILAAMHRRAGAEHTSRVLTAAGMMWDIRAKVASTVALVKSPAHNTAWHTFATVHGIYGLKTSPYAAYQRWHAEAVKLPSVTRDVKALLPHHVNGPVSAVFSALSAPLAVIQAGSRCRLMRYLVSPATLGRDIEKTLAEIAEDTRSAMAVYDTEVEDRAEQPIVSAEPQSASTALRVNLSQFRPHAGSYWDLIANMEPLEAQDIVDALSKMDDADAYNIEAAEYSGLQDLRAAVWGAAERSEESRAATRDAVV